MKPLDWTYELHVFGTRPKSLPLSDFGELVKRFADLLGSSEHIHFKALRDGSARFLVKVEEEARTDVIVHLTSAKLGEEGGSKKVTRIDEYLAARGWHGELRNRDGGVVISFPGAKDARQPEEERVVQQMDTLIGQVIKIGGRDETVPMTLSTSEGAYIDVTVRGRELAKRLALYLFGKDIRVSGLATWKRDSEGQWSCTGMLVDEFEEPDNTALSSMFDGLRELPGNEWNSMEDPIQEWKKLRGND